MHFAMDRCMKKLIIYSYILTIGLSAHGRLTPVSQSETTEPKKVRHLKTAFSAQELLICRNAGIGNLTSCHLYLEQWENVQLENKDQEVQYSELSAPIGQ